MSAYVFQEYRRGSRRGAASEPRITITRTGLFSINRGAYEMLGQPAYVALLFDRRSRAIAFKKVAKDYENAYPVRKQRGSASYLLSGKAFLQFIGAEYGGEIKRLVPRKEEDLVVVDLPRDESKPTQSESTGKNSGAEASGGLLDQDVGV